MRHQSGINRNVVSLENERRVNDRDALNCAAGQIEAALEKVIVQSKGIHNDKADDAFCDAVNALQAAAAELRVCADGME